MRTHSQTLLHIFGIPIRVAPGWILMAALITWNLTEHSLPSQAPDQAPSAFGFVQGPSR